MDQWNAKLSEAFKPAGGLSYAGSLSTLVGAKGTIGGIPYNSLIQFRTICKDHWFFKVIFNLYVPIGILGLAQAVLSCINRRVARFFVGAGEVETVLKLCGLKASGIAQYSGLQSSVVDLPVRSVLGESLVTELLRRAKEDRLRRAKEDRLRRAKEESGGRADVETGRAKETPSQGSVGKEAKAGREVWVVWENIKDVKTKLKLHVDTGFGRCEFFSIVAVIICGAAIGVMAHLKLWVGTLLVAFGMVLNASVVRCLSLLKFELPTVAIADGAPPGDALVQLMDDPNVLCVLQGSEEDIQVLLQKPVSLESASFKQGLLIIVSVLLYIYSAAVCLLIPFTNNVVQVIWVVVVFFGAVADLWKGSFDTKRHIGEKIINDCTRKPREKLDYKVVTNRTAAVASIILGAPVEIAEWCDLRKREMKKDFTEEEKKTLDVMKKKRLEYLWGAKEAKLLPTTGPAWENWWKVLNHVISDSGFMQEVRAIIDSMVKDKELIPDDSLNLFESLLRNVQKEVHPLLETLDEIEGWKLPDQVPPNMDQVLPDEPKSLVRRRIVKINRSM